jgi:hypothetical protein
MKFRRLWLLVLGGGLPACALLIALVLAGCAAPVPAPIIQTRIQVERVTLPAGLLTCQAEPALGTWTTQAQVADYVVRLHEAWQDCHQTVASIAQIENTAPPAPTPQAGK